MSMLTRTGTTVRKHRRRQSGKQNRRGSAPTILLPSSAPPAAPVSIELNGKTLLTPQPSPAKSVSFTFEKGLSAQQNVTVRDVDLVPEISHFYRENGHTPDLLPGHICRERSYSLVTTLQDANLEAEGTCEFVNKALFIIGNTRLVTLVIGLMIAFPLSMITAGGKYLEECPKEPKIPIYLLVGGCFGLLKLICIMWRQVRRRYDDNVDEMVSSAELGDVMTISRMTNVSLSVFLCVWFVLGNYWVFTIWIPKFESPLHDPQNWCDKHVYMFAFWQIIACYILIGIFFVLCFFFSCCHWILRCLSSSSDSFC